MATLSVNPCFGVGNAQMAVHIPNHHRNPVMEVHHQALLIHHLLLSQVLLMQETVTIPNLHLVLLVLLKLFLQHMVHPNLHQSLLQIPMVHLKQLLL